MIHLNASDERGIDIIRSQINQFVNSKTMFISGMKFVILDEVDYMTKNAQQALKYLIQESYQNNNIRFCLICNYLCKIDEGLQNELIKCKFNLFFINSSLFTPRLSVFPLTILTIIFKIFTLNFSSIACLIKGLFALVATLKVYRRYGGYPSLFF